MPMVVEILSVNAYTPLREQESLEFAGINASIQVSKKFRLLLVVARTGCVTWH